MKRQVLCRVSTFLAAFFAFTVFAYAYQIKGLVVDSQSQPEAFATVRIFASNDSLKAAALGVTDDAGAFALDVPTKGDYVVNISSVGKKPIKAAVKVSGPVADMGELILVDNAEELEEVVVVATRPLVSKEIDRIGYDVQADDDAKTSNVQDILRKVPMVTVDDDGTIKVKGSTDFKIYKNGRPNNAFSNNAKDIFKAIPAAMIKKIEVITDPGAREDAEGVGAILNIETLESASVNGVMGNVSLNYRYPNTWPMVNGFFTASLGKLALSAHGGVFSQNDKVSHSVGTSTLHYINSGNTQETVTDSRSKAVGGFWGIEGSYELDSLNLFTLEFGGFAYDANADGLGTVNMFAPDGNRLYSYTSRTKTLNNNYLDFNGNFNYQRSTRLKGETITLSYQVSNNSSGNEGETTYADTYNFPAPYSGMYSDTDSRFLEQTLQADWTRPTGKHGKFSVGGKFIHRRNRSNAHNVYDGVGVDDNSLDHLTTIAAGYFDYRYNIGRWNARAGLRYEYSRLAAKFPDGSNEDFAEKLNDWVPNASVMYNLSDMSSLKLSFSTRINRPGINYLNPNVVLSPTSQSSGNPDLKSILYRTIALNYSLIKRKFNLDASVSYDFADNTIASVTTVDENDYRITAPANVGLNRTWNFNLYGQWSASQKTTIMVNLGVRHAYAHIPGVTNARWGVNGYIQGVQRLPWGLRLQAYLFYRHGDLNGVYGYSEGVIASLYHGLSLQKDFLKEDRLTVRLGIQNPFQFGDGKWVSVTNRGDYRGRSTTVMSYTRSFGISIGYRFGKVNGQVKKTTTAIANDDLQGGTSRPSTGSN